MPKSDDPLGPLFEQHLRAELDRVRPRFSPPRYVAPHRLGAWRLAPAALAIGVAGILGLTAYAATGSPNPAVWTEHVVTVIHQAPSSPTAEPTQPSSEPKAAPPVAPKQTKTPQPPEQAEPTEQPEPTNRPEPSESPEPSHSPEPSGGGHGGSGSGDSGSSRPSPSPGDH
jgi:hypothetical protein